MTFKQFSLDLYAQSVYNYAMEYIWDPDKAMQNQDKHGVDFADAATIFDDDYLVTQEDPAAYGEQRFVGTGIDAQGRILTVVYTLLDDDATIRLISARRATRREARYYGQYRPS
jgi:uncharacterized DUF497 family protein